MWKPVRKFYFLFLKIILNATINIKSLNAISVIIWCEKMQFSINTKIKIQSVHANLFNNQF